MKKTILILLFTLIATPLFAGSLKGGYAACMSKELFDEMTSALMNKDEKAYEYLSQNGCYWFKAGTSFSKISSSWGVAKIRVYVGNDSVILWTNTENLQ